MKRRIKTLFVRPKPFWKKRLRKNASQSSIIQKDLELLRKHFEVRVVDFVLRKISTVYGRGELKCVE